MIQHTRPEIINLAEVEVYNMEDVNVALGRPVTASSNYGGMFPIEKFVDGTSVFGHTRGTASGQSETEIQWVLIDVGNQPTIKSVVIKNRPGASARAVGLKVQILGDSRKVLQESEDKSKYTINFNSGTPVIT